MCIEGEYSSRIEISVATHWFGGRLAKAASTAVGEERSNPVKLISFSVLGLSMESFFEFRKRRFRLIVVFPAVRSTS